jgi:group I intron endonuclease
LVNIEEKKILLLRAGVYKLTNKVNGHSYVGSSLALSSRLSEYFRFPLLKKRDIELAINEFGLENFELEV